MQDPLYRELILEHWSNPQNYGIIKSATIDAQENNPLCGDEIRVTVKIENNKITDIKFVAQGCAISKASASLFTEKIKGEIIDDIKQITEQEVLETLGIELTPARTKCALLVYTVLRKYL
jgi:nitrogen fixation protein NifU and related proteins